MPQTHASMKFDSLFIKMNVSCHAKRTSPVKNDVLENSYLKITFGLLLCLLLCVVSLKSFHA